LPAQLPAPGRPVDLAERAHAGRSLLGPRAAAARGEHRRQRLQRVFHIGAQRHLGRVVFAKLPVPMSDLDHFHVLRHRFHRVPYRHAQHIGAKTNHQIMGREAFPHPGLVAPETAHEGRVLGSKMCPVGDCLLIHRGAEKLGQGFSFVQGIAGGHLVAADDHRIGCRQHAFSEPFQGCRGGQHVGFHARGLAQRQRHLIVENVAGQRDEYRSGGRREGNLGGAADNQRQILQARDFHRPLDQRRGHGHQRPGE
jgi:hypothetical protein